jgi:hypothetical protein
VGFFKYSVANLIGSGARVLYAPSSWTLPVTSGAPSIKLSDIITLVGPDYAPKTGWVDLGAAREGQGAQYERNIEETEQSLEQATGAIWTDITDTPRSITMQIAEMTPTNVQKFVENAPASRDIADTPGAGTTGTSDQTAVDFGSFESLDTYRVAIIGQRRTGSGADVTEAGNANEVRGAFVAVVLFSATISAENAQYELQKGQIANVSVQMRAMPESTITDSTRDRGTWLFEDTGGITIATS